MAQFSAESDPIEIGAQLNVDAVLTSELDRSQGSANLRSEHVSTKDGSVLWNFQVEPAQASTEEQQIVNLAGAVARRLWANLQLRESERLGELFCYQTRFDECRRYYNIASGLDSLSPVLRMMTGSPSRSDYWMCWKYAEP